MNDCDVSPSDLGAWYADPLSNAAATALLRSARIRQQVAYRQGHRCFLARLDELVACFWLDRPVALEFSSLSKDVDNDLERATTRLAHGQLLMSRRLSGALDQLRAGFTIAWNLFPPDIFFEVLRRHELLAYLPVFPLPGGEPRALRDLLAEATVVRRFKMAAGQRSALRHDSFRME